MDNADALLGGLGAGDKGPLEEPLAPNPIKREQDSIDDFEHLERERRQEPPGEAARLASQSLLDMEREQFGEPRAPSAASLADRFTDSESDAGESPLHRPQPPAPPSATAPAPAAPEPEPLLSLVPEPAAASAPAPAPARPAPAPLLPEPVLQPMPAPAPAPKQEAPKPATPSYAELPQSRPQPPPPQPKEPAPVPAPTPAPAKAEPRAPVAHVIEAEVIFCQMGLDAWFDPQRLHPEVESLIYWRQPARSGAALGLGLALLVALACCSVVSVSAYAALLALSAAVAFRVYKNVLQAVQKTNEGHPFKWLLEYDISVPAERSQALAAAATAHLNAALIELRRLFLVEDLVDSLKFGVLLWCLTYVGACFNGITLIILGWIALFTLPKAYEMNKPQVDANLELARAKINEITAKVRAAVPLGRKSESEKDK